MKDAKVTKARRLSDETVPLGLREREWHEATRREGRHDQLRAVAYPHDMRRVDLGEEPQQRVAEHCAGCRPQRAVLVGVEHDVANARAPEIEHEESWVTAGWMVVKHREGESVTRPDGPRRP